MEPKRLFCGRGADFFFFFYDKIARIRKALSRTKKANPIGDTPKILLCCWSSLGDIVLASSVIEPILTKWPKASLGFLHAKEASIVLDSHHKLQHHHLAPSWLNPKKNKGQNLFSLFYHVLFIYPKVIREIRALSYDISLELNPFFPNSLPLMWKARIPRRIAFASGGYDVWMTDKVPFPRKWTYLPLLYPKLLQILQISSSRPRINLPFLPPQKHGRIILHMGTSDPKKEWPLECWQELAVSLRNLGYALFFTGQGKKETDLIRQIAKKDLGEDLSSQLSFYNFAKIIEGALAVLSVDSVSLHLAAFFHVPLIALYLYNKTTELWLPRQDHCRLLIGPACVLQAEGLLPPQARVLKDISPSEVLTHFLSLQGLVL